MYVNNYNNKKFFLPFTVASITILTACNGGNNGAPLQQSATTKTEVSCINATISSSNLSYGYTTLSIALNNTCANEQSLANYQINLNSQDISANSININSFVNYWINNASYNLSLSSLGNNQYSGKVTASNSKPTILPGQTITLIGSTNLIDPYDLGTAKKSLTINGLLQYPQSPDTPNETNCVSAALNYSANNPSYTNGGITFTNNCKSTIGFLDTLPITFKSQDITSAGVNLNNLSAYVNNKNYSLTLTRDANNMVNGSVKASSSRPYILPGQSITLNGDAGLRATYDLDTAQQSFALNGIKQYPEIPTHVPVPGCLSATINYSTTNPNYTSGNITLTNNCGSNQFLDSQSIKLSSQDITTRGVTLNTLNNYSINNTSYQLKFTPGANNTLIGSFTSAYSRPVILKNQSITFSGDAKVVQPFDLDSAQQSLMLNELYQYPRKVPTLAPTDCVKAKIEVSSNSTSYVPFTITLTNSCNIVQLLKGSAITLTGQNTKSQALPLLTISNMWQNNTSFSINCLNRSSNNQYCTINSTDGYPFMYPNQTLTFSGGVNLNGNSLDSSTLLNTILYQPSGIVSSTPIQSDGTINSLQNVPTTGTGRRTITFVNTSSQNIKISQITPMQQLPADITLNTAKTSCKVDLILTQNQSCDLVYDYRPKYEGVSSAINISMAGIGTDDGKIYTNTVSIPYSSRITQNVFNGLANLTNPKQGFEVTKTSAVSWASNVITNVPTGSFGLVSYTITNTSNTNLYAITLLPSKVTGSGLPSGIIYDDTRTTCGLNNKFMLKPSQSCVVVFKYQPTIKGDAGTVNFNLSAIDDWNNYYSSNITAIAYSSRK